MDRQNNYGNSSVTVIIVMAVSLLAALVLGTMVGSGDYRSASIWFMIGAAIAYVLYFHHYTWQIVVLMGYLGFQFQQAGIAIGAEHIALLLGACLGTFYLMSPTEFRPGTYLRGTGFGLVVVLLAIWVTYVLLHMVANHLNPYIPSQYSLKNSLKSYVLAFGGAIMFLWFVFRPNGIRVGSNWPKTLILMLFFSLCVNIGIRLYLVSIGVDASSLDSEGPGTVAGRAAGALVVPGLNMTPSSYILRGTGPLGVAVGLLFWTSLQWRRSQGNWIKFIVLATIFLGFVGAVMSGGRASMLFVAIYMFVIAVLRKRIFILGLMVISAMFCIGIVNIFSHQINMRAPFYVQRTLQYLMFEKGMAFDTVKASTLWRKELADRAIDEWKSDPRITLVGRGTYSFNAGDELMRATVGGYEAGIQTSLRRGATHRLITDSLIQYGVVGTIIVYLMQIAVLRFLWKLYKKQQNDDTNFRNLTLLVLISSILEFMLSFIGSSSFFSAQGAWLLVVLVVGYGRERQAKMSEAESEAARADAGVGLRGAVRA